jgi:hypothetical protein
VWLLNNGKVEQGTLPFGLSDSVSDGREATDCYPNLMFTSKPSMGEEINEEPRLSFLGRHQVEVSDGDVVLYFDRNSPDEKLNESNCRVGIVSGPGVLTLLKKRVSYMPFLILNRDFRLEVIDLEIPERLRSKVAKFFANHSGNPAKFLKGQQALAARNFQPFIWGDVFPPLPKYNSIEEFHAAWEDLLNLAQPGDFVFSSSRNFLSRTICWSTRGPFSHVALYVGKGELWDITLSGSKRCKLVEDYKSVNNRVAVYRTRGSSRSKIEMALTAELIGYSTHREENQNYNYLGSIKDGLKSFFNRHETSLAPNSLIYREDLQLVSQA